MWLSLFLVAFLIAATYFQAIQGLTSTIIMAVATVIGVAISFGTYEYVAETFLMNFKPEFAHSVAFLGMFVIPLAIVRVLLDMWISRTSLIPHLLDRAAGAVVGLCSAFLVTGMIAIAVQMVPWGTSVLGFQRFDPETPDQQAELWLKPDRVAASFGASLSHGIFSGSRLFSEVHPDLVTELGLVHSVPRGVRCTVPADCVSVLKANQIDVLFDLERSGDTGDAPFAQSQSPSGNEKFTRVRLRLQGELADEDGTQRFTPASIRLVGERNGHPTVYPAVAIADPTDPTRYLRSWTTGGRERKQVNAAGQLFKVPSNNEVDVAFVIDGDFNPSFVAYKFGGRAPMTRAKLHSREGKRPAEEAAASTSADAAGRSSPGGTASASAAKPTARGGRVSGVRFRDSHFGDKLPLAMSAYQTYDTEMKGDALEQGHIQGALADQDGAGSGKPVSRFVIPSGMRLLQLNVESLRPGSTLGKALNFSVTKVENYFITDDRNKQYPPVGKYAIAKIGGSEYVEVQYFPEYVSSGGRIRPFSRIKTQHLKGDYQLVYLFLVEEGVRVVEFSTGRRRMDLGKSNLVAP